MRLFKITALLLIFALAACTSRKSSAPVKLGLNLQPGHTYKLESDIAQTMQQTVHNREQKITTSVKGIMSFTVKQRQNDRFVLGLTYDKLQFRLEAPGSVISFNSETSAKTDNLYDRIYSKFIGKNFTVIMNRYGKVDTVKGLDSLGKEIIYGLKLENPMLKAQLVEDFKGMFGNRTLKGNIEMLTYFFPQKPVRIGETWSNTFSLMSPIPASFDNTWKLTDFDSSQATVKGNSIIESINGGAPLHISNMSIRYDVQGTQTSTLHIQPQTGWILSAKIESHISGTIKVEKSKQLPKGLEIPFDLKTIGKYRSL